LPDVERREELLPQWESAKPDNPSSIPVRRRYVSLNFVFESLRGAPSYDEVPPNAMDLRMQKKRASDDTEKAISNRIHDASN
jgi:hypothetical protein